MIDACIIGPEENVVDSEREPSEDEQAGGHDSL